MNKTFHERIKQCFHSVKLHLFFTRASLPSANPLITLQASAKSPAMFWFWIRAASRTHLKTGSTGLRA